MYDLTGHGAMISDPVRVSAYERALRQTVKPGTVVLEIGTGVGIMAVLACQLGAKRVYTVEPTAVIHLAQEIAAANSCSDRIEFIEDVSRRVRTPIQANIIVSDLRGMLPLLADHIPTIADARRRFLAPGGILVGRQDRLWAAIVDAPRQYAKIIEPWEHDLLGQDLRAGRRMIVNNSHRIRVTPDQLLTAPTLWATLDYRRIENPDVGGNLTCGVKRDGTGHGIVIWFDAELVDDVSFSSGPDSPQTVYSSMFLPWQEPVSLLEGQTVCISLQAKYLEMDYAWRWTTKIESIGHPGKFSVQFDQSQLKGAMLSPSQLRKSTSNYIPQLSEEGLIRRRVFELMDGKASLEQIAIQLVTEFPERFSRWQNALSFIGVISRENSRCF
jgi:type I protein arginine methyltransferase